MHHIRTNGPDHLGQIPYKPQGVAPLFIQADDPCGAAQQGFRIFFSAQADDDMFDIIGPMVDPYSKDR
jgi:hypothetical protein